MWIRTLVFLFCLCLGTLMTQSSFSQTPPATKPVEIPGVVAPEAVLRKLAGGMKFIEGPVWMTDSAGSYLLFSDIPANKIYKYIPGAEGATVWREPSGSANGNTKDGQGRLVTAGHGARQVTRTEADGTMTVLASTFGGKKLNSPNDVVVKSDGTIWFTDPPYGINKSLVEQPGNYVFRLDPGAAEPVAVATDFDRPNGLCFSPDEKRLYVADSGKPHHVRIFDVKADNTLAGGDVFCVIDQGVPDGMRCDETGRLFSSSKDGVQIFSTEGTLVGRILVPETVANLTFGGADRKTLYLTASTSLYAIDLLVAGAR